LVHLAPSSQTSSHAWRDHLVGYVRTRPQVLGAGAELGGERLCLLEEEGADVGGAFLREAQELN
jgi:hypothetical protein